MNPDETVRAFCESFDRFDVDEMMRLIADDCVYHNIPLEPVRGAEAIRQTLGMFQQMLKTIRFEVHHQTSSGNIVQNERVDWFETHDGKRYGLPVAGVFEVRDGKIVAWRDYFDTRQFEKGTGIPLA